MDGKQRENIENFYGTIEMPGGYIHNHVERVKTNLLYFNGQYKTGPFDPKGFRKFFFNITKPACDIATKFIDLDTKDFTFIPEKAGDEMKVWLMQRRFKQWLKDKNFGKLMNQNSEDFPLGHIVNKKTKNGWEKVPIANIRTDIGAQWLKDSDFVYEPLNMSEDEMRAMNWDQEAIDQLVGRGKADSYLVYECYDKKGKGWIRTFKGDLFTTKNKRGTLTRSIHDLINTRNEFVPAVVLDEKKVSKLPYREEKWEDVPGRWLGRGFPEYLEDNQVAVNEAENLERKGLIFKSLQIWQTRDDAIGGSNIFTDADNGDILKIDQEIQLFPKDNSDLAAFNNTRGNWTDNTERKTFTSDITTGANLPSRTPLGVANLQASLATSYFEFKREKLGLYYKDMILNDILPDFERDNVKEHTLTFLGSDEEIRKLDKAIIEARVTKAALDHAERTGFFPSKIMMEDARLRVEDKIKKEKNRYLKVPEGFYKNAKYTLDVIVTGESVDSGARSQVLQLALQIVGTNPAVTQNPVSRSIFFKLLGMGGISPVELNLLSEDAEQSPQLPQGGSVAAPQNAQPSQIDTPQVV